MPDTSSPLLVCARAVSKIYHLGGETIRALDKVDLDIAQGEFIAIMGPSGSGKSTLMNLIGALDQPTSGTMTIDGDDIGAMSDDDLAALRNRTLGFVFQQFNLLKRTTALDNVKLPLIYAPDKPADLHAAARTQLEKVGLGERLDHLPNQLSGGQQQRVSIARALINDPSIILADEPTGALDSETSNEIMQLFSDLNQSGRTIIIVTHEEEIADWCQRVIRLRDGKITQDTKRKEGGDGVH